MKEYEERPIDQVKVSIEEILQAALALPPEARTVLIDHLLHSLDDSNREEIDKAWREEIERRVLEVDQGSVELIPGDKVIGELRSRFKP